MNRVPSTKWGAAAVALMRRVRWLVLLAPCLLLVGALTAGYLWNEDFWWYLSTGEAYLEEGGFPASDPFVYTAARGVGWVYHSWLWTVLVALLHRGLGLYGVVGLNLALGVALTTLVYTAARVDRWGVANALATLFFLATIQQRLTGKAEVVSWLLLAVFFLIMDGRSSWGWRPVVALVGLQVLWANLHGGYPLGVFLALCYGVGGWLQARLGRAHSGHAGRTPRRRHPPLWLPMLLFVAAVADPRMFEQRLAPFAFVTGSEQYQPVSESGNMIILEWRSPFEVSASEPALVWIFVVASVGGLTSFLRRGSRSVPRLLFLAGMIGLGATAIRHLSGLALAAALVFLRNLENRDADTGPPRRRVLSARSARALRLGAGLVAGGLASASALALWMDRAGFRAGQSEGPVTERPAISCPGAADFIQSRGLAGPIFNDYQLGAYLGYRLWPRKRVFIDSRVLDPQVVEEYTRLVDSPSEWRRAERRYGFRTSVLGMYSRTLSSSLGVTLIRSREWHLAYVSALAVIFVRGRVPGRVEVRLNPPAAAPTTVPFPFPPGGELTSGLARIFLDDFPGNYRIELLANLGRLGRYRDVVRLAGQLLEMKPHDPLLLRERCAAHLSLDDLEAALTDCRTALSLRSEDPQIIYLTALVLSRSGSSREALSLLERGLRQHPDDHALRRLRDQLAAENG